MLTGKEFEKAILDRCERYKSEGIAHIGRYGVQASVRWDAQSGRAITQLHRSLPDFEGVTPDGRQIIFDAKVCTGASFGLAKYMPGGERNRQLKHMLDRSEYGCRCFFLIHWNARQLKRTSEPAETYSFPILFNDFWNSVQRGEMKSITRSHCKAFGSSVNWICVGRESIFRPDFLEHEIVTLPTKP